MTDPLDVMRRPLGATDPDPQFRRALLATVERELDAGVSTAAAAQLTHPPLHTETMEVIVSDTAAPHRTRRILASALGLAAASAAIIGLVMVNRGDTDTPPADQLDATIVISTTTTGAAILSDAAIAEAGLLSRQEVGGGYVVGSSGDTFGLDRTGGPGAADRACEPFLDTVFESPDRAGTVAIRSFSTAGASFQQYIVVFPDEAGATAMMKSVADPAFPACMSAVITEAYVSLDPDTVTERTPLLPIEPRPLATLGDEMVVLAFSGTFQFGGSTWADEGLLPFVRVGRAVTWMNPNSAKTVMNSPGYSDASLEAALTTATTKLRAAQAG